MSSLSKKDYYEPGDILCDMHYGFEQLPDNLEVIAKIRMRTKKASELLPLLNNGRHPGNKYLVIIGESDSLDSNYVAAYSYDGTTLGIVELKLVDATSKK